MKTLIFGVVLTLAGSLAPVPAAAIQGDIQPQGWCQVIPWMPMCPPMNK